MSYSVLFLKNECLESFLFIKFKVIEVKQEPLLCSKGMLSKMVIKQISEMRRQSKFEFIFDAIKEDIFLLRLSNLFKRRGSLIWNKRFLTRRVERVHILVENLCTYFITS